MQWNPGAILSEIVKRRPSFVPLDDSVSQFTKAIGSSTVGAQKDAVPWGEQQVQPGLLKTVSYDRKMLKASNIRAPDFNPGSRA